MKVLLTNDDGIQATGLNTMRRALLEVPGVELAVIAPDSNRSATARSITTREPLWVDEIEFEDGTDFSAIADGCIAVTPLHFDLTDEPGIESLGEFDLDGLLRPAAREVE